MKDPVLGSPASTGWGGEKPGKATDRESESEGQGLASHRSLEKKVCQGGGSDHPCEMLGTCQKQGGGHDHGTWQHGGHDDLEKSEESGTVTPWWVGFGDCDAEWLQSRPMRHTSLDSSLPGLRSLFCLLYLMTLGKLFGLSWLP